MARTLAPVWLESLEEMHARYPEQAPRWVRSGVQSLAFLPLLAEGRVMGVIAFGFGAPRRFSVPEQASMLGLARQCGLALERALLYEREHAARLEAEAAGQRLRLLADASALLSRSLEWGETVDGVARLAVGTFADLCVVDALEGHDVLRLVRHADPSRVEETRLLRDFPPASKSSVIMEAMRAGKSLFDPRVTAEELEQRFSDPALMSEVRELGVHSFISVSLVARQRTLGALSVMRREGRAPFTEEDVALAEELAGRAALAMDNARLFLATRAAEEESRQSATRLHLLVRVSQLVAEAGLNLGQVLEVLVHEVAEAIGPGCILQLVSAGRAVAGARGGAPPGSPGAGAAGAGGDHPAHARGRGAPGRGGLHGADAAAGLAGAGHAGWQRPRGDAAAVPPALRPSGRHGGGAGGPGPRVRQPHGAARGARRPYSRDDQLLLESIASRAALAIEDARLYSEALQALRIRDDFLSVAGHELKNPLNALQLQLRVLARKAREDKLSESLVERAETRGPHQRAPGAAHRGSAGRVAHLRRAARLQRAEVDLSALAREASPACPRSWRAPAARCGWRPSSPWWESGTGCGWSRW